MFNVLFRMFHGLSVSQPVMSSACFFFLMIRRPPRSTLDRSSAASDVYKRQLPGHKFHPATFYRLKAMPGSTPLRFYNYDKTPVTVSYTHLRAHETVLDIVCRLLLDKKKKYTTPHIHKEYKLTTVNEPA